MSVIRCQEVTKYYEGARVLSNLSFSLGKGEMLGLIGRGGAGKSLLAKLLCGLVRPERGRIYIEGREITGLSEPELQEVRGRMGMVFQNYALFDFLNVEENIALPLEMEGRLSAEEIRGRVSEMLDLVALQGIQEKRPNELSGGMKKRVSFARAVIQRPPILVYDDPTAGLDPVTSAKIFSLLKGMQSRGTTAITISHDLDGLSPLVDRWLLLDEGEERFAGTTEEIAASMDPRVRAFWHGELEGPD